MDKKLRKSLNDLESINDVVRMKALKTVLALTESRVDWVYEEWDSFVRKLDDENSFQRSIAIMVLCNLAKSDKEERMGKILNKLLSHTKDEKFITSRQCLLHIWKVAVAGKTLREKVIRHLETRFAECETEKHYNLLRQDIVASLQKIYESEQDNKLRERILKLISAEKESKYRKKYEALLNN
jgi:uncharacterized membrane-anchored protein YjiN (DUF445 family)